MNWTKYQILSKIAKDVHIISVSTVAPKSAFSNGDHIFYKHRNLLGTKMVDILVCSEN